MNQNLPVIAKRAWRMVRVIFFMLRKGISKRKLMVSLNMMLKRGNKVASKAIGNLMFHHDVDDLGNVSYPTPPCEYEFSCSNTPMFSLPFAASKRRHHHHNSFFACAFNEPPTKDDDMATVNAVKLALEMLNNNNVEAVIPVEASPMLPGFGKSPKVRQLRVTDSPFPVRDVDGDNGFVDKKAEEFIQKFYKELRATKENEW